MATTVLPVAEIKRENVRLDPDTRKYQFDDEAMLKLILDDASAADNYMNINSQWSAGWTQSIVLQQSPQSSFDGIGGLTVPKFTLSNHLSAIIPKLTGGLFYADPPMLLRPRPGTDPQIVRAKEALFSFQFDEMQFEEEVEAGLEQMALLGTGIWKWGWCSYKKSEKKYVRKTDTVPVNLPYSTANIHTPESDEFEVEYEDKDIERPWFKACDIRTVLVTPGLRRGDIRKAKGGVVYRDYATWDDLDKLRDIEGYDIPSREELEVFFLERKGVKPDNMAMMLPEGMRGYIQQALPRSQKSTADPFENGLEILERWDDDKVGVVLCHEEDHILIRNEQNPYGVIPFFSANWRNLLDCFYGQGLGQLVGSEQMVEQGTIALALGMLAYGLQPTAVRKKGFNAISQPTKWEQGGIIDVEDDVDKAYKFLEFPKVPPEAWQMVGLSQATAQETSGANQQTTMGAGAAGVKTTGMRSGTGAALVGQANASRLDGPMERFIRQVFKPFIYKMDELNNEKLPTRILNEVLGDEIAKDFKVDHIEFRNAKIEYDVLAGAHLGAKKEKLQFLPFVMQMVNNPTLMELAAEQGLSFNFKAWFDEFSDLAGGQFNQDLFVQMTPQQKQKRAANSPAGVAQIKGQAAKNLNDTKFAQQQQLLEQEQLGEAAAHDQKIMLEHALNTQIGTGTFEESQ